MIRRLKGFDFRFPLRNACVAIKLGTVWPTAWKVAFIEPTALECLPPKHSKHNVLQVVVATKTNFPRMQDAGVGRTKRRYLLPLAELAKNAFPRVATAPGKDIK